MSRGFLITFEGGEGVGKTTQIQMLSESLKQQGYDVVVTREPGGTPAAEEIRSLLSHPEYGGKWRVDAECLLLFAARAMHIQDVISPALDDGKVILCDRYIDSTRAYQGYLHKLEGEFIKTLEQKIVGDFIPDLTVVLDIPVEVAMKRVQERGVEDHYDKAGQSVHEILRHAFLDIAEKEKERCFVFNADQSQEGLAGEIKSLVTERLLEK